MKGPYSLELVREYVEPGLKGVYMLDRYDGRIHYVGRSDTDLQSEILRRVYWIEVHTGNRYECFWFEYCPSRMRAYKRECELWHKYGGEQRILDNYNHPAVPQYSNWRCPVIGCPYA